MKSRGDCRRILWGRTCVPGGGTIDLMALRYGDGRPRQVVIAGLHGDEPTPIYILAEFVREHAAAIGGTLDIVPAVNWMGLLLGRRRFPFGGVDLNRSLVDGMPNAYARQTMDDLVSFCEGADLVADLHSWDSPTVLMGISHALEDAHAAASINALTRLGCEFIWRPQDLAAVKGTLGDALAHLGVPYCAAEFSPAWLVDPPWIADAAARLADMLSGVEAGPPPLIGGREPVVATEAGLFFPVLEPGSRVELGQTCGAVLDSRTLRCVGEVISPTRGMVVQLETRRAVFPGQTVAFIGTPIRGAQMERPA